MDPKLLNCFSGWKKKRKKKPFHFNYYLAAKKLHKLIVTQLQNTYFSPKEQEVQFKCKEIQT